MYNIFLKEGKKKFLRPIVIWIFWTLVLSDRRSYILYKYILFLNERMPLKCGNWFIIPNSSQKNYRKPHTFYFTVFTTMFSF